MTTPFILHHYDTSPFSEKVRIALGVKGLAWRSVNIPNMMPKPDLIPLTGGYRRTPVAQIGADIFCDTQVILAEIDHLQPAPKLASGLDWAINWWADRLFFQTTVPIIFGLIGDSTPQAFLKDREQLSGRPFDITAMRAASGPLQGQWRAQAGWIESQLRGASGAWLGGYSPTLADAAAYMNIWFLERSLPDLAQTLLEGFTQTLAWKARVKALGHGVPTALSSQDALDVARDAEPRADDVHDASDPLGAAPGDAVFVMADDYGRDRVDGRLVAANPQRVVIEREEPNLGRLHLHFPRAGYLVTKA
ncbi:MAG: glutathione S-transferase [Caulobacteraceae bacterium]|nr:glutathione S-transferase [Caulobacteraceae bacterium]